MHKDFRPQFLIVNELSFSYLLPTAVSFSIKIGLKIFHLHNFPEKYNFERLENLELKDLSYFSLVSIPKISSYDVIMT